MVEPRAQKLTLRVSDTEAEILKRVANAEGLTVSEWVRLSARLAFDKLKSTQAKGKPKKK